MSWERGAGFRITGVVTKEPFVREKFARVQLSVPGRQREKKIDVVTFDAAVIGEMRALGVGQTVQMNGTIEMESVKDKAKNEVKIDGYAKWVPLLVAKKVDVEGASTKPAAVQKTDDELTKGW